MAGDRIANTDMDTPPLTPATLLLTLDILGAFVFAMSGAAAGVKKRLDVFGVCVLAFVAATAGGLIRDLLIGAVTPAGISDWRYIATSLAAGAVTFLGYPRVQRLNTVILAFDAAGLGRTETSSIPSDETHGRVLAIERPFLLLSRRTGSSSLLDRASEGAEPRGELYQTAEALALLFVCIDELRAPRPRRHVWGEAHRGPACHDR